MLGELADEGEFRREQHERERDRQPRHVSGGGGGGGGVREIRVKGSPSEFVRQMREIGGGG